MGRLHGLGQQGQHLSVFRQTIVVEVAQDVAEFGLGRVARHLVQVDETLPALRGLRRSGMFRQRGVELGGQCAGIDQIVIGRAGMDRDAAERHHGHVRREGLAGYLAGVAAIQRVGPARIQILRRQVVHAPADFLVRRKAEADAPVLNAGRLQQSARHAHHDCHTGLVVGPQQCVPAGGHDVLANLGLQIGRTLRRQHQGPVIGERDGRTVPGSVDARFDPQAGKCFRRVHMGHEGDRRSLATTRGCGDGGQHRGVVRQLHILGPELLKFHFQHAQQIQLSFGRGHGCRVSIRLGVHLHVVEEAFLQVPV